MKIAIVSNITAGIGLMRDFELLRDFLQELGHEVIGYQYDESLPTDVPFHDLAIFLEVIPRNMLELAPVKWAFLNPEWCKADVVKIAQRHMDKVFAKTFEANRLFEPLFPGKTFYTGFLTRDQYDVNILREPIFLHIGGNSSLRGTQAVLDAWKWKKDGKTLDAQLIIISTALQDRQDLPNVTILEHVEEEELKILQNRCRFHLYPSETEGFGHALHEGFSVGATVLVTHAPPLDDLDECYGLPAEKTGKYNLADLYEVSALDIYEAVQEVLVSRFDIEPRNYFLACNEEFKEAFAEHFESQEPKPQPPAARKKGDGLQIAFIGNFKASESTENMIRWALEQGLGHEVELLQENEVNLAAIRTAAEWNDLLIWVRTPDWLRVPDREMDEFLQQVLIPTASIHLDKFWGIPEREALIGVHPFWKTDHVFTADGSHQEDFQRRCVNHHWMHPAVSEVYCHPGQPWDMYRCDVGFVGAKDYHAEYPFRHQLVEFLEKTYGERFKHITGLRGHGLNDFYASCKVTVGDCIFAGTPNYWSDRVPETCGRYGFLLHPAVDGLEIPVATYIPQDLDALQAMIEMQLGHSERYRRGMVYAAAQHVKQHDTWTVRMREILDIVL